NNCGYGGNNNGRPWILLSRGDGNSFGTSVTGQPGVCAPFATQESGITLKYDPQSTFWYVTFPPQCGPIRYKLPNLFFSPCGPNMFTLDQGGNFCTQVPATVTVTPLAQDIAVDCCHSCDTPPGQGLPRRLYFTITNPRIPGCYDP